MNVSVVTVTVCVCAFAFAISSAEVPPPFGSPDVPPLASAPPIGDDVELMLLRSDFTSMPSVDDQGAYWFDFQAQYLSAQAGGAGAGAIAPSAADSRKWRGFFVMPALSRSEVCSSSCVPSSD